MLRNCLEEAMGSDQMRLLYVLQFDGRKVGLKGVMPKIEEIVVSKEDVRLEPFDAHAPDCIAVFDGETVRAIWAIHAPLVDDFAGAWIECIEDNAAVRKRIPRMAVGEPVGIRNLGFRIDDR